MQMSLLPVLLVATSSVCNGFVPLHQVTSNSIVRTVRPRISLHEKLSEQDGDIATLEKQVNGQKTTASYLDTLNAKPAEDTTKSLEIKDQGDECEIKEETETEKLLRQVKEAGTAGVISYALWELGFWFLSVPVCLFGYYEVTGHLPDLSNSEDLQKLGAEAFAFVNFARFAVPLRIGLALSTTPWIQENIVDRFMKKDDECDPSEE